MKIKKGMRALSQLLVMALLGAVFVPAVSAEDKISDDINDLNKLEQSILLDTKLLDKYSGLSTNEQEIVLTALYNSLLSEEKLKYLTTELKLIWSNKSKLTLDEKNELLKECMIYTLKYYNPDVPKYSTKWGGAHGWNPDGVHNALAQIAGIKMESYYDSGVHDSAQDLLNRHACDPDYWGIQQMPEHYLEGAILLSNAPDKSAEYANQAKTLLNNNIYSNYGWEKLSCSMHFMSDMAVPHHTQGYLDPTQLATHSLYENYVNDKFLNSNYGFKTALNTVSSSDYHYISNPATSARYLASYSDGLYAALQLKIASNPTGWGEDSWVKSITRNLLKEALKYNMGLVEYST